MAQNFRNPQLSTPSTFIGRRAELKALTEWLSSEHVKPILIFGMGGTGKTALVSRLVADHFSSDQIAWLSFYAERDPAALDDLYQQVLKKAPKVVVLDDIEHARLDLIAAFLKNVQRLYPGLPVILTSRHAIDLIDADSIALNSLSMEEAVALLRTKIHESSYTQLRELAQLLGKLPLALELATGAAAIFWHI